MKVWENSKKWPDDLVVKEVMKSTCVAAVFFPFPGGAGIEQASQRAGERASEGARRVEQKIGRCGEGLVIRERGWGERHTR